jgi:hypothetical protein
VKPPLLRTEIEILPKGTLRLAGTLFSQPRPGFDKGPLREFNLVESAGVFKEHLQPQLVSEHNQAVNNGSGRD